MIRDQHFVLGQRDAVRQFSVANSDFDSHVTHHYEWNGDNLL